MFDEIAIPAPPTPTKKAAVASSSRRNRRSDSPKNHSENHARQQQQREEQQGVKRPAAKKKQQEDEDHSSQRQRRRRRALADEKYLFSPEMLTWRPPAWLDTLHSFIFTFSFANQRLSAQVEGEAQDVNLNDIANQAEAAAAADEERRQRDQQAAAANIEKGAAKSSSNQGSTQAKSASSQSASVIAGDEALLQVLRRNFFVRIGASMMPAFLAMGVYWLALGFIASASSTDADRTHDVSSSAPALFIAGAANLMHNLAIFSPAALLVYCTGGAGNTELAILMVSFFTCFGLVALTLPTFPAEHAMWTGIVATIYCLYQVRNFVIVAVSCGTIACFVNMYNRVFFTINSVSSRRISDYNSAALALLNSSSSNNSSSSAAAAHISSLLSFAQQLSAFADWPPLVVPGAPLASTGLNWVFWGFGLTAACGSVFMTSFAAFQLCGVAQRIASNTAAGKKMANGVKRWDLAAVESSLSEYEKLPYADEKLFDSLVSISNTIRNFARFVPRTIITSLRKQGDVPDEVGLEEKTITVLFLEVANFPRLMDSILPSAATQADDDYYRESGGGGGNNNNTQEGEGEDENGVHGGSKILNDFFTGVRDIVESHGGCVLSGSHAGEVTAIWGAPSPVANGSALACCAALQISAFIEQEKFSSRLRLVANAVSQREQQYYQHHHHHQQHNQKNQPRFATSSNQQPRRAAATSATSFSLPAAPLGLRVRTGIHTGNSIVGNIGSGQHTEFAAFGSAVRWARAAAAINRAFNACVILLTDETLDDARKWRHEPENKRWLFDFAARPVCHAVNVSNPQSDASFDSNNNKNKMNGTGVDDERDHLFESRNYGISQLVGIVQHSRKNNNSSSKTNNNAAAASPAPTTTTVPITQSRGRPLLAMTSSSSDDDEELSRLVRMAPQLALNRVTLLQTSQQFDNADSSLYYYQPSSPPASVSPTTAALQQGDNDNDNAPPQHDDNNNPNHQRHHQRRGSSNLSDSDTDTVATTYSESSAAVNQLFSGNHHNNNNVNDHDHHHHQQRHRDNNDDDHENTNGNGHQNQHHNNNNNNNHNSTEAVLQRMRQQLRRATALMVLRSCVDLSESEFLLGSADSQALLHVFSAPNLWLAGERKKFIEHVATSSQTVKKLLAAEAEHEQNTRRQKTKKKQQQEQQLPSAVNSNNEDGHNAEPNSTSMKLLRRNGITAQAAASFLKQCKIALKQGQPCFYPKLDVVM